MSNLKDIAIIALCITGVFWFAGSPHPESKPAAQQEHNVVHFVPEETTEAPVLTLGAVQPEQKQESNEAYLVNHFGAELPIIRKAAERNNCHGELFTILLAIRKAENGRAGLEFGVMHPKAKNTNLDTQAGWAAATVVKNHKRWMDAGQPDDFITFLGNRYCPPDAHPLNKHWQKNVRTWVGYLE